MNTYIFNDDPRANSDAPYKSFKDLQQSEEWKKDSSKYYYINHIPAYCEGFSHRVLTFDSIDELFDRLAEGRDFSLYKIIRYDYNIPAFVMGFKWDPREDPIDEEGKAYLLKHLRDKCDQYNYWWVLGHITHKDGSQLTPEECIERQL